MSVAGWLATGQGQLRQSAPLAEALAGRSSVDGRRATRTSARTKAHTEGRVAEPVGGRSNYRQQDLASAALQRLVRIQCGVNNFVLPRVAYDQNNPYTALVVSTDWFAVQALIEPEIVRLAPYVPGLDVHVQHTSC